MEDDGLHQYWKTVGGRTLKTGIFSALVTILSCTGERILLHPRPLNPEKTLDLTSSNRLFWVNVFWSASCKTLEDHKQLVTAASDIKQTSLALSEGETWFDSAFKAAGEGS